jgi:dienelactone hydrolase
MSKFWLHSAFALVSTSILFGCSTHDNTDTAVQNAKDNRATLEETIEQGSAADWIMQAKKNAQQTVTAQSLKQMQQELLPHETVYIPKQGQAPFPVLLFMHGCSGATPVHEQEWAKRFNSIGVAVIGIDSYAGRGIDWNDACNFTKMTPWERSGDIAVIMDSLKDRDLIDPTQVYLTGFSHGALTIWSFLEQLSNNETPLSLTQLPKNNYEDVIKGTFMFYGSCPTQWTVNINSLMLLGEDDRYVDESVCLNYAKIHPTSGGSFENVIYPNATHTFDHSKPNQANVEAGSRYDEAATMNAWRRINAMIEADGNAQ